jgi:apolipoprotein D and lipocalin family protein
MRAFWPGILFLPLLGCAQHQPIRTEAQVDLERFMGDWYVIANIPTWLEQGAHNAVESYRLEEDRRVATRFSFRDGGFDGPEKVYNPVGFVQDDSNAVWGMQFVWPIRAEYRIVYVDPEYQRTIIGRSARDYVWLMARSPELEPAEYAELERIVSEVGYDSAKLRPVPQRWPEQAGPER